MIVYSLLNTINGKRYVGITTRTVMRRVHNHMSSKSVIGLALIKYGKASFKMEVIDHADTVSELSEKEQYWIKYFNCTVPLGYNMTSGGTSGFKPSEELSRKLSAAKMGHPPTVFPEDLIGRRFGRLVAIRLLPNPPARWLCLCDCGNEHDVAATMLKNGNTKSCGCLRREITSLRGCKYGESQKGNYLYVTWMAIRARHGDMVCLEWRESYLKFASDMGEKPQGTSICRRNRTKHFSPDNCYWGTRQELAATGSRTLRLEAEGKIQSQEEWRRELRINPRRILKSRKDGTPFHIFVEAIRAERRA